MVRRALMLITDLGMLAYWAVAGLMAASVIDVPGDWLFRNYHEPHVVAWNWSFFPLDILLSLSGLQALRAERRGDESWRIWAAVSLTLTMCVGLMALSYWTLMHDFDPAWWAPNLFLLIWPAPFLARLLRQS